MNKKIVITIVAVLVAVSAYLFFFKTPDATKFVSNVSVSSSTPSYTLADIASHNSSSSCWTAVNGKIFDVTQFIPTHPGGQAILKACGKDGTSLFMGEDQHAEQNAQATLDTYFIGTLKS